MAEKGIIGYKERLNQVVEQAYLILRHKIAGGEIVVHNEASMQLQFGSILKTLGQLYEFSPKDHFTIELESKEDISATAKSPNGARCDIKLAFYEGRQTIAKVKAFIELKFFPIPTKDPSSETTTDNRFGVLMDIENLELYQDERRDDSELKPLCYEIVYAENSTYCLPKAKLRGDYNIGDCEKSSVDPIEYAGKTVTLRGHYVFHWDKCADNQYWLKVNV